MKRMAVVTMARAEYGLIAPVLRELRMYEDTGFGVDLVVSGMHLDESFGLTVREIEESGDRIDYRLPVTVKADSEEDTAKTFSETLMVFAAHFRQKHYDAVLMLGDRYEMLAAAVAAGMTRTPVFHMCGGDTTEGAMDEWIRHSISKIAYLHFVSNEISRKRVIQLGEAPERVLNYGSTSLDNIYSIPEMSKKEILQSAGLAECDYALCTWHPVTMDQGSGDEEIKTLLEVMTRFPDITFIVTKANSDPSGNRINQLLEREQKRIHNMHLYSSLGVKRYISLMRHCSFVLGNSSSGIIEAPACGVPTINIGDRQKGRLRADSVIDCGTALEEICEAIQKARSPAFMDICKKIVSPYGDGQTAKRIAVKCMEVLKNGRIDLKKHFYDIEEVL